ncbi:hypothetical protein K7472_17120 [Streptomyces sp. PTM05]|uniref:Uncharacterized protein n=1 Tax=Streptantibioticus parmotrematis TaxID=2873249 RepID=A0ABS7QXQ7_9ACTN|nr:hypothetical protein [Streptantibioticus parmotrematis]MBY8886574.1 hypothetical protein [Streptantibioticus parmotrematis]
MNLIDPEKIPQFVGDLGQLETAASGLKSDGGNIAKTGGEIHSRFQGLSAFYHAPEAEQLFATTKPVAEGAKTFGGDLGTVAAALSEYAHEVRPIAQKLVQLKKQAVAFRAYVQDHPHWRSDGHKVSEHNNLVDAVDAAVAAFWAAERRCANKIEAIFCGVGFRADDGSHKPGMYGYTAKELDHAKGMPWGEAVGQTHRWNTVGAVFGSLGHYIKVGVWDGLVIDGGGSLLTGLYHLVDPFDWHTFTQSWEGLGDVTLGFLSKAVPNLPGAANSLANGMAPGTGAGIPTAATPQWVKNDQEMAKEFAKSFVAWDEWKTNPVRAAGTSVFNVGTLASGSLMKLGDAADAGRFATAAKVAGAIGKAGHYIDPMTYVVKAVGKLPKISDIAAALDHLRTGDLHSLDDLTRLHGTELPDGALKFPDGSVLHTDGQWHFPDGTVIEAKGPGELTVAHAGHDVSHAVERAGSHTGVHVGHDLHGAADHAAHAPVPGPDFHNGHDLPAAAGHGDLDGPVPVPGQAGGHVRPPDDGSVRSWTRTEEWANGAYDSIRATDDVHQMAAALHDAPRLDGSHGFSAEEIAAVKHHVFEEEHPLESVDGGIVHARYDANPDMAEAWIRLRSGRQTPADLLLLEHELAEHQYYVDHPGSTYAEAHAAATEVADWSTHREPPGREDYSAPFTPEHLERGLAGPGAHDANAPPHVASDAPGTQQDHHDLHLGRAEGHPDSVGPSHGDGGDPHVLPAEPHGNLPDGSWRGPNGLRLGPEENATTDRFLARAVTTEPHITGAVETIAHDIDHGRLNGLEYRLKGEDSLKRKIATSMLENPELTPEEGLARVKDSLRYTLEIPTDRYTDGVQQAVADLHARGFENVTFKNTWRSSGYKGINSTWRDPATGQVFEVQFHTPESFAAKMDGHALYERERLPGVSADEVSAIKEQQKELFGRLAVPSHAEEIRLDWRDHQGGFPARHAERDTPSPLHGQEPAPPHADHATPDGRGDHVHEMGSGHGAEPHQTDGTGPADPELSAAEQAGKAIGDRHGVDVNYTAHPMAAESARDVNRAIDRLSAEYPKVFGDLEVIRTVPSGDDSALAYAILDHGGPEPRGIYLDSGDFSDYGERMSQGADEEATNWTVPGGGSVQGIFYHEFGHHCAQRIFDSPEANQELEHVVSEAIGRPYDSSSEPHDPITESEVELVVSEYGATDPHEMVAELFAEYKLAPSPRPLAASIGQIIDRYLRP